MRLTLRRTSRFVLILLLIEFLDEFVYGAREAAWPLVRSDLNLTYAQVGILLGVPGIISSFIEPFLGILGDVWRRRVLILSGGALFTASLVLSAASQNFAALLAAFILFYPASGAFVSLSQANLMDSDPPRREHNMARWTFAGSVGVVLGPLALAAATALHGGWRELYVAFAALAALILALAWRYGTGYPPSTGTSPAGGAGNEPPVNGGAGPPPAHPVSVLDGLRGAAAAIKRPDVVRWLVLLQFSDLMLDVLLGYLALYFVDVAGATAAQAGLAVAVWTGVGLLGDFLLIPLLERVPGARYLRVSVVMEMLLFPLFLLLPGFWPKVAVAGLLGLFNSGWYAILQAGLYAAMPGQSGTALAVNNFGGLVGALIPLALGLAAERFGLASAMWLLLAGPVVLLVIGPGDTRRSPW